MVCRNCYIANYGQNMWKIFLGLDLIISATLGCSAWSGREFTGWIFIVVCLVCNEKVYVYVLYRPATDFFLSRGSWWFYTEVFKLSLLNFKIVFEKIWQYHITHVHFCLFLSHVIIVIYTTFFVSLYCIGEHFSIVHKYVFNVCLYISALNCVVYVTFLFLLGLT